uniref:Transposase Tc1-like domain-containing protein n=1 Tax=Oncorhynchus tshawytscha TaxID=74940 RepID=A0AAZ3NVR8_ONCTS
MLHRVSRNRHMSTSTVQRRLRESSLHGRIAAKKPLLKDTNKKRLAWAKQWTLDRWKSVLWSESKLEIFGSNRRVFVRRRVGERMISACVVPTVKQGGGCVMVWGCFAGDTDLFRIQGILNQQGYHSILQQYVLPSGLGLVGLSIVFQQDNGPTHLQAVYGLFDQEGE